MATPRHHDVPAVHRQSRRVLLANLDELYERCSQPGWDGYDAMPITEDAYEEARELITLLPTICPPPDVTSDPAGHVSFEWYKSPRQVFVISVNGTKVMTYAGFFGSAKISRAEPYHKSLPKSIVDNLAQFYSQ